MTFRKKKFDAVEMSRRGRERVSALLAGLSYKEKTVLLNKRLSRFRPGKPHKAVA